MSPLSAGIRTWLEANVRIQQLCFVYFKTALQFILENIISARVILLVGVLLISVTFIQAANRFSVASGNWNSTSTWSATSGGTAGASVPVAGDEVFIENDYIVTVDINTATCKTITIGSASTHKLSTLQFNNGSRLTVLGTVILGDAVNKNRDGTLIMTSGGTLICQGFQNTRSESAHFTAGTGTIELTADNTLPSSVFSSLNNLTISGGTTLTSASLNITGNLTVNSGATFNTQNFDLTLGGNFTNNGTFTAGSSNITITGITDQSVAGFTTTGTVSMTKTGGTATLLGNVNGGALSINGTGGTLNLGTGLTHTFTGTWTRSDGTLNGGSSILKLGAGFSGTSGTFTAGTGTVEWNASGSQTIAALTYNNLSLSGSGAKSITTSTSVTGNLSISGATASIGTELNISAGSLTLGGFNKINGTWGSTTSTATYKDNTFFAATTGIVTVTNDTRPTPTFSGLTASQSICYGTATVTLSGTISSATVYPANGELVGVTINGVTQNASISGGVGGFSINFNTATIPTSGTPYIITYSYAGGVNLKPAANNTSTALTVNPATAISSQSTATQTQCLNGTFTPITVTATGVGLTYQWYKNTAASTSGGTSLGSGNGAQTNNYTPQASSAGTLYYYCIVTGTCSATSAISGAFIVNPILPVSLSIAPSANPVLTGTSVTFTATPINGGTAPVYQWMVNGTNVGTNSTTYSYTPTNNDVITCVLTSNASPCATGSPAISNAITMTVNTLEVNATLGTTLAYYPTLKAAFDKINDGTHQGTITIKVNGNTTETTTASLNASGSDNASYTSVLIYPTGTYSIKGYFEEKLIDLVGANKVTIDGRINQTGEIQSLSFIQNGITNPSVVFRLSSSASYNTIRYCNINGSCPSSSSGVIYFNNTTSGNGNDNNTIEYCNITNANGNRPRYMIYSKGDSEHKNSSNTVQNNNIYDFLNNAENSTGVYLVNNSDNWTISGNSFYETTSFAPTAGIEYSAIRLNSSTINNINISGNYIGGSAPLCSGTFAVNAAESHKFYGIYLSGGSGSTHSVQNNIIKNFTYTSTSTTPWTGIYIESGNANIGNITRNTIGASTGTGSIICTNTDGSSKSYGINCESSGIVNIQNNQIGAITTVGTATISHSFYGIYKKALPGNINIGNNLIGSISSANSIQTNPSSNGGTGLSLIGIQCDGTEANVVSGNTISNLTNTYFGTSINSQTAGIIMTSGSNLVQNNTISNITTATKQTSTNANASLIGISQTSISDNQTISGNTIYNLSNTAASAAVSISGIYFAGGTSGINTITQNFIHSLSLSSSNNNSSMNGIALGSGTATCANNIINLGKDITRTFPIYGIWDDGATSQSNSIFHNSIFLSGNPSGTTANTYAYYKKNNVGTSDIRNNIFLNARSGGNTGKHYAIFLPGTNNLTINYNDYIANGTNGILGYLASDRTTLSDFQSATGQDANSLNKDPQFVSTGSTIATDYKARVSLPGAIGTGIAADYGLIARLTPPTMGAWEQLITKWKGSISTAWNNSDNWTANILPESDANLVFDAAPANHCQLDQDRSVTDITNAQSTYRLITNGHRLTVKGNLNFSGGAQIDASANGSNVEFAGTTAQTIPSGAFYNNAIYNLTVNNANNVILNGTLRLLNTISATSGRLDAFTNTPTVSYAGMSAQTIESGYYQNEKAHNLSIDNAAGVTLNTNFTVNNSLTINAGDTLIIAPQKQLDVLGAIVNNAGTSGLVINSTADSTGSLIHYTDNVPATVKRYISGAAEDWHFLSSPVSSQTIGGEWTPSGTYGNHTGYDLYVWNEPTSCWIYKLNTTSVVNWNTVHTGSNFSVGRGYLYSVQAANPTKTFAGTLNNGKYSIYLTNNSTIPEYAGFNLIGNPYPSAIDWKATNGWTRGVLTDNNIWIWNPAESNYGVYNSWSDEGTLSVTRYIPPMQSFFVKAASNGDLTMTNDVRVHDNTTKWKSAVIDDNTPSATLSLTVKSEAGLGADEVLLSFGSSQNAAGASKLFSPVATAPSLYLSIANQNYSVYQITGTPDSTAIPVQFKAGKDGKYKLSSSYDWTQFETLLLEDCQNKSIHNLKSSPDYEFTSRQNDASSRFVLHFSLCELNKSGSLPAQIYSFNGQLTVDLTYVTEDTEIMIFDSLGRLLTNKHAKGGIKHRFDLPGDVQLMIVSLSNRHGKSYQKVVNSK